MVRKILVRTVIVATVLYGGVCAYMYFSQESLIFHPKKLSKNSTIEFGIPMAEMMLSSYDGTKLNAVFCSPQKAPGREIIFFLHGNAGNLRDQEQAAKFYTGLGYIFFTFDYRGFGKSEGEITSETQFFRDIESMYREVQKSYPENRITVVGYSVGTASAAYIASKMNPSRLVLIAPYYSLVDMTGRRYPYIPTALLKYRFETNLYLKETNAKTVLLVHGDKDVVLPFEGSKMLAGLLDKKSRFIPLKGQGHDDFEHNESFLNVIRGFLRKQISRP